MITTNNIGNPTAVLSPVIEEESCPKKQNKNTRNKGIQQNSTASTLGTKESNRIVQLVPFECGTFSAIKSVNVSRVGTIV
jgi:hypothetical protein